MPSKDRTGTAVAAVALASSRYARTTLVAILAITLALGFGLTRITTDVNVADVLPRGNDNTDAAHKLAKDFRSTFTQQVTLQVHVDNATGYASWARDNARLVHRGTGTGNGSLPAIPGIPGLPGGPDPPGLPRPPPLPGPAAARDPAADPANITDEVYVRATDELVRFIQDRTEFDRSVSIAALYNLVNWTAAGSPPGPEGEAAFALPPPDTPEGARRYAVVDRAVKAAIPDAVDALASPSWNHAAVLFSPAANNTEHTRVLGESILAARDEFVRAVAEGRTQYTVFGPDNPPLVTVDLPIANAHSSQLVREDLVRLMPLIAAFILACLWVAFRNTRAVAVSFTALALGVVWTYGFMGYMGIALNTLNMIIVPMVMGIGIDYAIHMINEFSEHQAEGHSDQESFRQAGLRAGTAMLIATLTTVAGLAVMVASPSLLIAQLGLLSAIAIGAIYLLTLTFIPAMLTVAGTRGMGAAFSRSRVMPALGRAVSRHRWLALAAVAGLTVAALASSANLQKEAFGDPGKNYPPGDPIRREHEVGLAYFYEIPNPDVKANILTFQGSPQDLLSDRTIAYMRTIEANLKREGRVIDDTLRTLPFFIETWLTVRDGPTGAIHQVLADNLLARGAPEAVDTFPRGHAELNATVREMFDSPFRQLASLIINAPKYDMAAMTFSVRAGTYDEAAEVWGQVWGAVAKANASHGGPPPGVKVAFVGNTATNYLFIAEELPWLTYMGLASNVVLLALAALLLRTWRAMVAVGLLSAITTAWWLGVLPLMGVGLAITLTLPLIFISAIGTDYAVHLVQNVHKVGSMRAVLETTGKAVLFSTVTTLGAFALFIWIQNVAVSRTMVATSVAILLIFAATLLVVPAFYPVWRKGETHSSQAIPLAPVPRTHADGRAAGSHEATSPPRKARRDRRRGP